MGSVNYATENLTEMEKYYKALYEAEKKKNEELTAQLERFKNPYLYP